MRFGWKWGKHWMELLWWFLKCHYRNRAQSPLIKIRSTVLRHRQWHDHWLRHEGDVRDPEYEKTNENPKMRRREPAIQPIRPIQWSKLRYIQREQSFTLLGANLRSLARDRRVRVPLLRRTSERSHPLVAIAHQWHAPVQHRAGDCSQEMQGGFHRILLEIWHWHAGGSVQEAIIEWEAHGS